MRGEALSPVKTRWHSIGECQDREVGVGGLVSRGKESRMGGRGEARGETGNVNKENNNKLTMYKLLSFIYK